MESVRSKQTVSFGLRTAGSGVEHLVSALPLRPTRAVGPAFLQRLLAVTLLPFSHSGHLGDQMAHLGVVGLCASLPGFTFSGRKAPER